MIALVTSVFSLALIPVISAAPQRPYLFELTDDSAGKPRTIYQQFSRGAALRYGRWKIVTSNYEGENWALYDMDADGTELHNLANELPDKCSALKHMWQEWADRVTVRR